MSKYLPWASKENSKCESNQLCGVAVLTHFFLLFTFVEFYYLWANEKEWVFLESMTKFVSNKKVYYDI